MDSISLSINLSYYCNFRCNFCYLSDQQLSTSERITPSLLFEKLQEIGSHRKIVHVDLYGGEVGLLPTAYLEEIYKIIRIFYSAPISVITNLSHIHPFFLKDDVDLSVSWDYIARQSHEKVFANIKSLAKPIHILMLASRKLLDITDQEFSDLHVLLGQLDNVVSLEIKPYSKNKHHLMDVTFNEFENWVKKWIQLKPQYSFEFINETKIRQSLQRQYKSWSDEHLYITPDAKLAVLEFDINDLEYFMELDSIHDYFSWAKLEKEKVTNNLYCSKCSYLGSCLSEHLQNVKSMEHSCNGFRGLLDWYKNERTQGQAIHI